MKLILRSFISFAALLTLLLAVSAPDASAQGVNNRTYANSGNYYSRVDKVGLQPGSCVRRCRQIGCRSWVYVRGRAVSSGVPYCLFYRQTKRMIYSTCCVAGHGRGGGVRPPPPPPPAARRAVINYPRWNGRVVDHCRTWARNCGAGGANYYCRLRGFQRAQRWTVYRPGSTYVIGSRRVCSGGGCVGFRQVVCVGRRTGGVVPPSGGGGGRAIVRINNPRWRGAVVDHCRTWARNCGRGGAVQYCQRRGYRGAASWATYRPGRTYVVGSNRYCNGGGCVGFRYINCRR